MALFRWIAPLVSSTMVFRRSAIINTTSSLAEQLLLLLSHHRELTGLITSDKSKTKSDKIVAVPPLLPQLSLLRRTTKCQPQPPSGYEFMSSND